MTQRPVTIPMKTLFALTLALALVGPNAFFQTAHAARNAEDVTPLLIGSKTPDAQLQNQNGKTVSLNSILTGKHTILIFYRGSWCPYCNRHLSELAAIENDLKDLGYQIVAISPDTPENLNVTDAKLDLAYQLYSDVDFEAIDGFGIGFDHSRRGKLPVPSVFIVTPDKKIRFQYVDPAYQVRIPAKLLKAAAESILDL